MQAAPTVGVLALQGAFLVHELALKRLGCRTVQVRSPEQLDAVDALVLPGGESTTMSKLLDSSGLFDPIAKRLLDGMPTLGTCAGMILLAGEVSDGRPDQRSFGVLDVDVRRNGFGRQVDSFETDLSLAGDPEPLHAVFIRAPRITRIGDAVEVLAAYHDEPVLVRQGHVVASSFHPELTGDTRVHAIFLQEA